VSIADRLAVAGLATGLLAVALGAWLLLGRTGLVGLGGPAATASDLLDPFGSPSTASVAPAAGSIVVDVEGAVVRPGIIELTAGSRVADAIAAAGGYAPDADLVAAAAQVNLAAAVHDGQQIVVPLLGAAPSGAAGGGGGGTSNGLVDLNSASSEALDALPGIGPVTVGKIMAARSEQPFRSLDELVTRKVLTSSQLDKIRDLVTVG
jgi:competence protein ComEA